jgi:pyruvate/2-oxoglutarate dehydrogenase complex dihydrolipoamide dehydrogenase (E3) component
LTAFFTPKNPGGYRTLHLSLRASPFHIRILHADGTNSERDSEILLFCISRVTNSDNIGIQNTDLKPNARGYVETDDRLRTPVEGVYAMGDVAGRYMFTHAANFEFDG